MKRRKNPAEVLSAILNVIFFTVVLAVIAGSLYFVFRESRGSDLELGDLVSTNVENPTQQDMLSTESPEEVVAYRAVDQGISTIIPPDQSKLTTITPEAYTGLLTNPGIGWIYRWGNGIGSEVGSSILYSERDQISWKILNPAAGEYNWAPLDNQMAQAVAVGKQYAFRVYTMIGENYGGHKVPNWVLEHGAVILPSGEPDYSNCEYQEAWGKFVNELVARYDGNPNVAFIDISGYGNFNEWSWEDGQTVWDYAWDSHYAVGTASQYTFSTMDGQARRRLADMFLGGSFIGHSCRDSNNISHTVDYEYPGFQKSQLVMPYAGIIQSTQYVFTRRTDVGFRHDCLGRPSSENLDERLSNELSVIHRNAPIVFETCSEDSFKLTSAYRLLNRVPASVIHNANIRWLEQNDIADLLLTGAVGYKYQLTELTHSKQIIPGQELYLKMVWINVGNSSNYPQMGQDFVLHVFLEHQTHSERVDLVFKEDISAWLPSTDPGNVPPPDNIIDRIFVLPEGLTPGKYDIKVGIIDQRTGNPIAIANVDQDSNGLYLVSEISIGTD